MNLTLAQLVDILQDVGIAHRDGHPLSTGRADVPNGITLSLEQDIDLTERLQVAADAINNAITSQLTLGHFTNALVAGGLVYYDTGSHQYENCIREGESLDEEIEAAYKALATSITTNQ